MAVKVTGAEEALNALAAEMGTKAAKGAAIVEDGCELKRLQVLPARKTT